MTARRGRRLAALDIGTNSVRLLGVEAGPDGALRPLVDVGEVTRLGATLVSTGSIAEEDERRTEAALGRCLAAARGSGIDEIDLAGTEVFRASRNGAEVAARMAATLGWPVRVLSEAEEAAASYLGVAAWPSGRGAPGPDLARLVIDIGGGSSELVLGRGATVRRSVSLPIGALRITERWLRSDPPARQELTAAREALAGAVKAVDPVDYLPTEFGVTDAVGVGGTHCALGAWVRGVVPYDAARVEGARVDRAQLADALEDWAGATLAERMARGGLSEGRARLIVGGALVAEALFDRLGLETLRISTRGLRHGLILLGLESPPRSW